MATESPMRQEQVIKKRWKFVKKIGSGAFGNIYSGLDLFKNEEVAIKVASSTIAKKALKMEVSVMRKVKGKQHFKNMLAYGKINNFKYLVTESLGPNLYELKKQQPNNVFSVSTTLRVGRQMLNALETLHQLGVLHRNIQPDNFTIGQCPCNQRTVYLSEFGISRHYIPDEGHAPAPVLGVRGNLKYASINVHHNKEIGQGDDLWSLLYSIIELISGKLPWWYLTSGIEIGTLKSRIDHIRMVEDMPQEIEVFLNHVKSLKCGDMPDYKMLYDLFDSCMIRLNIRDTDPFDWELQATTANTAEQFQELTQENLKRLDDEPFQEPTQENLKRLDDAWGSVSQLKVQTEDTETQEAQVSGPRTLEEAQDRVDVSRLLASDAMDTAQKELAKTMEMYKNAVYMAGQNLNKDKFCEVLKAFNKKSNEMTQRRIDVIDTESQLFNDMSTHLDFILKIMGSNSIPDLSYKGTESDSDRLESSSESLESFEEQCNESGSIESVEEILRNEMKSNSDDTFTDGPGQVFITSCNGARHRTLSSTGTLAGEDSSGVDVTSKSLKTEFVLETESLPEHETESVPEFVPESVPGSETICESKTETEFSPESVPGSEAICESKTETESVPDPDLTPI